MEGHGRPWRERDLGGSHTCDIIKALVLSEAPLLLTQPRRPLSFIRHHLPWVTKGDGEEGGGEEGGGEEGHVGFRSSAISPASPPPAYPSYR